jgi:alpha-L-rhamnosidase
MKISSITIFLVLIVKSWSLAQTKYEAPWISYPSANVSEYGVYHFRKAVELAEVPQKLLIHVSADNRYNLFVNGQRVCYGPAKGDLHTYKYDVIDIAPFLKEGKNQLAALVYNGGKEKPLAFLSVQTAFFLKAEDDAFNELNSDESWKVLKNMAYQPISYYEMLFKERWFYGFYACGPGDEVDASSYPWSWEQAEYDDSEWVTAENLEFQGKAHWNLVPRNIAFMDNHLVKPAALRKVTGINFSERPWKGDEEIVIPANTIASILIDYELFTMGYPELVVDGGAGSSVKVKYAEALYEKVNLKAHRDSVNDLTMYGVWDIFHPDGEKRTFRPLWKRTFRYVQLEIETKDEPLTILSHTTEYSGYPYPEMSTFKSNDKRLNEIFDMGLRTLRMCSGETYYDTPFYEQLSYGGDNRPIGALSVYNSTDDRLFREVMRLYPQSENSETGLFKSAYPSRFTFDMGSWSLAWIQSLYDYYLIRGDSAWVKQFVPNMERVLGFYERHLNEKTSLIGTVKNQNFIDWSISKGSIPRSNEQKEMKQSVLLTLYFVHSLDCAIGLYKQLGEIERATIWETISTSIKKAVYSTCWDKEKQLFKDYADKEIYSQHTNIMAILCDVVPPSDQSELLQRVLKYDKFNEMASSYFSFFLFKAMQKTGQEELFLKHLDFWNKFIDRGLTTCGETGFASHDRSDCHAWSAHPAYFLLSSVCGIKPADIGFNNVMVTPNLGELTNINASMPHPSGRISVKYKLIKGQLQAIINLPNGMKGTFNYMNKEHALNQGINKITVKTND